MGLVWIAVVLKPQAEKLASFQELQQELRKYIKGDHQVFFPAAANDQNKKLGEARVLIEGYIFVHVRLEDVLFYSMEDSPYFEGLLCEEDKPCIVPDSDIAKVKAQVESLHTRGLGVGAKVRVVGGLYRNLYGVIIGVDLQKKMAQIQIQLTSKKMAVEVPVSFLEEEK